jgi:hypothetical protein
MLENRPVAGKMEKLHKKSQEKELLMAVFRIRISMFLGLLDPDPLVRGMDPDPSFIKQK